jgi:hypothetical protein
LSPLGRPILDAFLAFAVGVLFGFVLSESEILESRHNVLLYANATEIDQNRDGETDLWYVYRGPDLTRSRQDRDFNGSPDRWDFYRKELPIRTELDDNFDGEIDVWVSYDINGNTAESQHDTDYDGVADLTLEYENDVVVSGKWHPNGGPVERAERYENGVLRAVHLVEPDGTRRLLRLHDEFGRELPLVE